jgi:hypothetical protein
MLALPAEDDPGTAKVIAARDCDVLVDAAGLTARVASMLCCALRGVSRARHGRAAARRRRSWMPRSPTVDLASSLRASRERSTMRGETADALAERWDAAVRMHASGDLEGAAAGYAAVLAAQPRFAPAHHLAGVVRRARERKSMRRRRFAAAIAAEPGSSMHASLPRSSPCRSPISIARSLSSKTGLSLDPRNVSLLRMRGRILLRSRDGAQAERAFRELLMLRPPMRMRISATASPCSAWAMPRLPRAHTSAPHAAPDLIDADFNLGVVFQQQGNRRAARPPTHVLAVDPRHVAAYKHLGELLLAAARSIAGSRTSTRSRRIAPRAVACGVRAGSVPARRRLHARRALPRRLASRRVPRARRGRPRRLPRVAPVPAAVLRRRAVARAALSQAYDALGAEGLWPTLAPRRARKPGRLRVGTCPATFATRSWER